MLIEKGANVNALDKRGKTPLHYIASFNYSHRGLDHWTEDDISGNFKNFVITPTQRFIFKLQIKC